MSLSILRDPGVMVSHVPPSLRYCIEYPEGTVPSVSSVLPFRCLRSMVRVDGVPVTVPAKSEVKRTSRVPSATSIQYLSASFPAAPFSTSLCCSLHSEAAMESVAPVPTAVACITQQGLPSGSIRSVCRSTPRSQKYRSVHLSAWREHLQPVCIGKQEPC